MKTPTPGGVPATTCVSQKKGHFLQIGQMAPVRMISPGKSVVNCEIQETTCRNLIPGEKYPRRVNYNCIGTKKF